MLVLQLRRLRRSVCEVWMWEGVEKLPAHPFSPCPLLPARTSSLKCGPLCPIGEWHRGGCYLLTSDSVRIDVAEPSQGRVSLGHLYWPGENVGRSADNGLCRQAVGASPDAPGVRGGNGHLYDGTWAQPAAAKQPRSDYCSHLFIHGIFLFGLRAGRVGCCI